MHEPGKQADRIAPVAGGDRQLPIPFPEFVGLIALLMALTALSMDIMLPALPAIAETFNLTEPNHRQLVLVCYLVGLAAGQVLFGPISDRMGRKPVLLCGLVLYVLGSVGVLISGSFFFLLLSRALQGFGAASPRVIAVAIVRDFFSGRDMARVMSLVMMTFIVVPVFAPAVGQGLLQFGDWTWIFLVLLGIGLISLVWTSLRLPGQRPPEERPKPVKLLTAAHLVISSRPTVGYGMASGFVFGCLVSYITSAQQVFMEVYRLGASFPIVFGAVAGMMAVASFTNAGLVQRYGMRRVSHTALVGFTAASLLLVAAAPFEPPLIVFAGLVSLIFFSVGFIFPNFNAIAMQPLGSVAGTASSFIGFYTTAAGALFGWFVGHAFNGTMLPLAAGFAVLSVAALITIRITEGANGLFRGD